MWLWLWLGRLALVCGLGWKTWEAEIFHCIGTRRVTRRQEKIPALYPCFVHVRSTFHLRVKSVHVLSPIGSGIQRIPDTHNWIAVPSGAAKGTWGTHELHGAKGAYIGETLEMQEGPLWGNLGKAKHTTCRNLLKSYSDLLVSHPRKCVYHYRKSSKIHQQKTNKFIIVPNEFTLNFSMSRWF